MRKLASILAAILFVPFCAPILAYEIDTHAELTLQAFMRSDLHSDFKKLESQGLFKSRRLYGSINTEGVGRSQLEILIKDNYFGIGTNDYVVSRVAKDYDVLYRGGNSLTTRRTRTQLSVAKGNDIAPFLTDWLTRGSVREDDAITPALIALYQWKDPLAYQQTDNLSDFGTSPLQNVNRFCNHFYDPINNRGLRSANPLALAGCSTSSADAVS